MMIHLIFAAALAASSPPHPETLTIIGKDGSIAAIPFPSHDRCVEAICILADHKTCGQIVIMQEAQFARATAEWKSQTKIWASWRKAHPCVDHIESAVSGGAGWTAFTDKGKECQLPSDQLDGDFLPPSGTPPKHDDFVKFPTVPNVTSAECLQ